MTPEPLSLDDITKAYLHITRRTGWHPLLVANGTLRVQAGYQRHGDAHLISPVAEAIAEAEDIPGYGAIALVRREWSWKWWLVVWLAGLSGRLLLSIDVDKQRRKQRMWRRMAARRGRGRE